MNKPRKHHLELLAPAGSPEAFFAALEAGADAVYLGMREFSARARATNFTLRDLETLVPYAHDHGKKVYVTVNTLVKQLELPRMLANLMALDDIHPDAVIVQDLGVALLTHRHTKLAIHGSTQMTVHNSAGARQLKKLGFDRVILARECTLDEMVHIAKKSGIEIEVFAHGALCFSYSGQCYFSSFLGGKSANRGRCTQPCRRKYSTKDKQGAFFSPNDLCLVDQLPELAQAGVVCVKIEGRLRNVSYVERVVSAYRDAIDNMPERPREDVILQAQSDFGREKTPAYFKDESPSNLITPHVTAGTGIFLGKVKSVDGDNVSIVSRVQLQQGARLRINRNFEGEAVGFNLRQFTEAETEEGFEYTFTVPSQTTVGDLVFLVADRNASRKLPSVESLEKRYRKKPKEDPNRKQKIGEALRLIGSELTTAKSMVRKINKQAVRAALPPGARDIIRLMDRRIDEYIVPLRHREIYSLPRSSRNLVVLRVPVFARERELPDLHRRIRDAISKGFTRFLIGNISHFDLFDRFPEARLQADYTFGVLNNAALLALALMGAETGTVSLECDRENLARIIQASRGFPMELVAYGRPPLFTSRMQTMLAKKRGTTEISDGDTAFLVDEFEKMTIVVPREPFALMGALRRHQVQQLAALRLELTGADLQKNNYNNVRTAVTRWQPIPKTRAFNFHPRVELE